MRGLEAQAATGIGVRHVQSDELQLTRVQRERKSQCGGEIPVASCVCREIAGTTEVIRGAGQLIGVRQDAARFWTSG